MSDDPKPEQYTVSFEDEPTIPQVRGLWTDPAAPFSNLFKYTGYGLGYEGDYNTDTTNTRAWKIDKGLENAVRYRAPKMIGNEGMTLEPGAYEIDWTKLPKGTTPYGQNIAPAFTSEEDYKEFKKNPNGWVKKNKISNPHLLPRYDKNYGWVVHSGESARIGEERQAKNPMSRFSNTIINQILPMVASSMFGNIGFPTMALGAVNTARAIGGGQKWGNVAANVGASMLGNYLGNAVGGGIPASLLKAGIGVGSRKLMYPSASSNSVSASNGAQRLQYPLGRS